jgi:HK97 gp10 family phage protein
MSIQGLEALQRNLQTQGPRVRDLAAQVVSVTTFAIHQRVQATIWRDSGLLASQVSWRMRGLTGVIEISADGWYWHFLEYGTVRMAARPRIRPAAELESPIFERRFRDVARRLESEFGRAG